MSPYNPEVPFDVIPELFDEPQEEISLERYALLSLDMYAYENQRRGYSLKLSEKIGDMIRGGEPTDSEDVLKLEYWRYSALKLADEFGMRAKAVFALGCNILTEETEITDLRKPIHTYVRAKNPADRRMLDSVYGDFYNRYGGLTNVKERDTVRAGKIPVRISQYSNIDRHCDQYLYGDDKQQPTASVTPEISQSAKNHLIRSKELLIDSLSVLGMRRGRLMWLGIHDDTVKNSPAFDRKTSHLSIPIRQEGQSLKTFCDHLQPDHMVQYVKLLHAEATELELLYLPEVDPEKLAAYTGTVDEIVERSWKEFWNVYNGWEEDTNDARVEYRDQLRAELSQIRKADKVKRKSLIVNKFRPGQMLLDELAVRQPDS